MKNDLERLKGLRDAATSGEWKRGSWSGRCRINHRHDGEPPRGSCKYEPEFSDCGYIATDRANVEVLGSDYDGPVISEEDLDLIAAAVNALPDLIAEIEALRAGGWQGIESAPKDGTRVLLWMNMPDDDPYVMLWDAGGWSLPSVGLWDGDEWQTEIAGTATHWSAIVSPLPA